MKRLPVMEEVVNKHSQRICDKLVKKFKERFRLKKCKAVIAGGHARVIHPHLKKINMITFDPYFTLRSMDCYARKQKS